MQDVHHGNGTQEIFDQNKTVILLSSASDIYLFLMTLILLQVLYISLHRHEGGKFYPGTGAAHEVPDLLLTQYFGLQSRGSICIDIGKLIEFFHVIY